MFEARLQTLEVVEDCTYYKVPGEENHYANLDRRRDRVVCDALCDKFRRKENTEFSEAVKSEAGIVSNVCMSDHGNH
jgi:hypothetical protein